MTAASLLAIHSSNCSIPSSRHSSSTSSKSHSESFSGSGTDKRQIRTKQQWQNTWPQLATMQHTSNLNNCLCLFVVYPFHPQHDSQGSLCFLVISFFCLKELLRRCISSALVSVAPLLVCFAMLLAMLCKLLPGVNGSECRLLHTLNVQRSHHPGQLGNCLTTLLWSLHGSGFQFVGPAHILFCRAMLEVQPEGILRFTPHPPQHSTWSNQKARSHGHACGSSVKVHAPEASF